MNEFLFCFFVFFFIIVTNRETINLDITQRGTETHHVTFALSHCGRAGVENKALSHGTSQLLGNRVAVCLMQEEECK